MNILSASSDEIDNIVVLPNVAHDFELGEKGLEVANVRSLLHRFHCNGSTTKLPLHHETKLTFTKNLGLCKTISKSILGFFQS